MLYRIILFITLCIAVLTLGSCLRDNCENKRTYVRYDPIVKTRDEIRAGVKAEAARAMRKTGKIYTIGNYLLINERLEGLHVIDNSDPSKPKAVAFWNIPGNVDMAVRDRYLYVDQYTDLLSIDVSDLNNPKLICRQENVFGLHGRDGQGRVIVDYTRTNLTEEISCEIDRGNWFRVNVNDVIMVDAAFDSKNSTGTSGLPAGVGQGGSYARFGQVDNYLYTVDNRKLRTYLVDDPSCPVRIDSSLIGWDIETLFPYKNRLFIGSETGMYVFKLTNPAKPVNEALFRHARACDPVVCDDYYAYVTLHDGTVCEGFANQLDVINISALPTTTLTRTYPMKHPKGLSVLGNNLFLCDDGLKIYDKSNPADLKLLAHLPDLVSHDVIALADGRLLLIGEGGFWQLDVSDPKSPKKLSFLPTAK